MDINECIYDIPPYIYIYRGHTTVAKAGTTHMYVCVYIYTLYVYMCIPVYMYIYISPCTPTRQTRQNAINGASTPTLDVESIRGCPFTWASMANIYYGLQLVSSYI